MNHSANQPAIAFCGNIAIATGPLAQVALAAKAAAQAEASRPVLVFAADTGTVIDLDLRGTAQDVVGRLEGQMPAARPAGRPRLGVIAREITLLPRHWDWLAEQQGGASVALRRLVEAASRLPDPATGRRKAQEAAYRFMAAMAGDFPSYEEANRALFGNDAAGFAAHMQAWPMDVRIHAEKLAQAAFAATA